MLTFYAQNYESVIILLFLSILFESKPAKPIIKGAIIFYVLILLF